MIAIDDETFEAAKAEADRRNTSVEAIVAERLKGLVTKPSMDFGEPAEPVWIPGVTRAQLYWERARGGREPNHQVDALEELVAYAQEHPFQVDLTSFSREDLYERG